MSPLEDEPLQVERQSLDTLDESIPVIPTASSESSADTGGPSLFQGGVAVGKVQRGRSRPAVEQQVRMRYLDPDR